MLASLGLLSAAESWPQFRGPTGQGISSATHLPVTWNTKTNVVWKAPLPGKGWSSPVLSGKHLYLTAAVDGRERSSVTLRALCVNAKDGKILWDTEVFTPDPSGPKATHGKNSLASSTPIVRGNRLFVHFGHMGTAALDLSGKVQWRQTGLKYSPVHGNGGSPVLVGGLLVFSCDGAKDPFVVALDAGTGEVRWRTPRNTPVKDKFSFSTPLEIKADSMRQIISAGSGLVGAYDPADGKEIWRVRYGEGHSVVPRPVYAHGLLFVSTGYYGPVLLAIKPAGAHGDVTESGVVWRFAKAVSNTPSMLVVGDEIYFVSDKGIATCLDARTGMVHWSERLEGEFSASPVYAEGRIYLQSEAGVGWVVRADRTFELLSKNDLEERTLASYAVAKNALFIRSEYHLWRVGK
ncbi:MAG: serine/threonine protein kinase [Acidobacteria bacterium]|nr:serine/threonine protein kinase [Acidobacteriota bacterium]